ncbi:DUF4376 domain-containing protein [Ectothiorhodospira shaposhnikovii]|uniref:DUF4376 domain-containing protein n=1 Tax=Ectothiorhodospira shaposhnikovii TaxID=1054 RepID=UPI001EE96886|nr:DUF4376 domain-containing protein [Ectothiorhodospira shaposhnikovii]MCG5512873.1 DUF4376 domain-containing protein [Ectothiorhodospira shaposhnikovii]
MRQQQYLTNDGEVIRDLNRHLPSNTTVIFPHVLTHEDVMTHGVVRCEVVHPKVEWWQTLGAKTVDGSVSPAIVSWEVIDRPIDEVKSEAIFRISRRRFELEDRGVTIDGVRYSGSRENRQTLDEAVRAAARLGITHFVRWKDSDNNFHANHPVSAVEAAIDLIVHERSQLINAEGEKVEAVMQAASVAEVVDAAGWE